MEQLDRCAGLLHKKSWDDLLVEYETYSGSGDQEKTRTSTTVKGHRHLKPTRLPIPPPGHGLCPYSDSGFLSTLRRGQCGELVIDLVVRDQGPTSSCGT